MLETARKQLKDLGRTVWLFDARKHKESKAKKDIGRAGTFRC